MEIFLSIVLGLLAGGIMGYFIAHSKNGKTAAELAAVKQELDRARQDNARLSTQMESLKMQFENERRMTQESHLKEIESLRQQAVEKERLIETNHSNILESSKEGARKEVESLKSSFAIERKAMSDAQSTLKETFEETKVQMEKQWKEKMSLLKTEFQELANEVLKTKSGDLQNVNKQQMEAILNPLKEKMENFEKAVKDSDKSGAANKASIEKAIEDMMKRAQEIGDDAVNLTKALKGNSKVQGDWGEMLLESILEKSGLRKGEEYSLQESFSMEGERGRPDVIVRFPEKRAIVIDSKVSLTAYSNYMSADTEKERADYLKAHLKSVKDHVNELSTRDYSQCIKDSVGYVLMFIPNEASYILAVQNDPSIGTYAYDKHIILISPTNLMMALQLAYNLWQSERQSQNVQEIVRQGSALYDKFVSFVENFAKVGTQLDNAKNTYNETAKQLSEGSGNLVKRVQNLSKLGLKTKKQIPGIFLNDLDEGDEEELTV
ncbi:MAG TPA: DNA recombination protein RmuC [Bacteroidales bacterium]